MMRISSSQNAEALLGRTGESEVLDVFESGGLVTFENTCGGSDRKGAKSGKDFCHVPPAVGPGASPRWL